MAGPEPDVAIAQLDGQLTSNDDQELVGVSVGVPDELALSDQHRQKLASEEAPTPTRKVTQCEHLTTRPCLSR